MGPASGLPVTGFPEFWTRDGRYKEISPPPIPEQTDQARPIVTVLQRNPAELKTVCHYLLVGSNLHWERACRNASVHSLLVCLEQGELRQL